MSRRSKQKMIMSFVAPAALLCESAYSQQPSRDTCIKVEQYQDKLCISFRGDWAPEMLLNGLSKVLMKSWTCHGVEIGLMDMKEVDPPRLRSLVAALTAFAGRFRCIWVTGLQPKSNSYLHHILSQALDDGTWKAEIASEIIGFTRQRRTQTVQGGATKMVANLTGIRPGPDETTTPPAMQVQGPD